MNDAPAPTLVVEPVPAGVRLIYSAMPGAVRYQICRESPVGGACQNIPSGGVGVLNGMIYQYDLGLPPGTLHAWRVLAYQADDHFGESPSVTSYTGPIRAPQNLRIARYEWEPTPAVVLAWDPATYDDFNGPQPIPRYQIAQTSQVSTARDITETEVRMPLRAGETSYQWTVTSMYPDGAGGWWTSNQATVSYELNHYRLVALGFRANATTGDDPANNDGAGDEVYLAGVVNTTNRALNTNSVDSFRTPTFGQARYDRIRAGSLQPSGGIQAGDAVPAALRQWITTAGVPPTEIPPEPSRFDLPWLVWEGTLDDDDLVVVDATLWEDDQQSFPYVNWLNTALEDARSNYPADVKVNDTHPSRPQIIDLRDRNWLGPNRTNSFATRCWAGINLNPEHYACSIRHDRALPWLDAEAPNIGVALTAPDFAYSMRQPVVLSRAAIDAALAAPGPDNNRPGTIIYRLEDATGQANEARYEMYFRLERLEIPARPTGTQPGQNR